MWFSGQKVVLSRAKVLEAPTQSAASFGAGVVAFVGTYGLQSMLFPAHESHTTVKDRKKVYVPPQSIGEAFQRVGRPVLIRAGAGFVAFFCAGMAQTYVALRSIDRKK